MIRHYTHLYCTWYYTIYMVTYFLCMCFLLFTFLLYGHAVSGYEIPYLSTIFTIIFFIILWQYCYIEIEVET